MEHLEQQLCEATQLYIDFDVNLKTGFEKLQQKLEELLKNNEAEQTPNPKGKRAKHMAIIQDDPESEEVESNADSSIDSQRPQRSTRTKNAASYKELPLNSKIRRPSPEKSIKEERISTDGGKENDAPNKTLNSKARLTRQNSEDHQKRKSKEDPSTDSTVNKKVKLTNGMCVEIIETPVDIVVIGSDGETDKMPPPSMPAPKARGRPRTRKAPKKQSSSSEVPDAEVTTIKQERTSVDESSIELDTPKKKETKTKKKKDLPMPILLPAEVKTERVSLEKEPEPGNKSATTESETSVYEDAPSTTTSTKTSIENAPVLDETYKLGQTTPNTTVTVENATFNIPKSGDTVNNDTFQVKSPHDVNNETYTAPQSLPTPNVHDSIMTEDRSDEENELIAKLIPALPSNVRSVPNSKKYEIFNPNIPSPIKAKVQAFEKFTAATSNAFMSPASKHRVPGRLITTPGTSKLATPLSLPRIPQFKPMSSHNTPIGQSNSAPLVNKVSASVSKLVQKKLVSKHSTTSTSTSSRDPSVEDLKRTQSAIEAKKKAREEKQRLAQLQREQLEKERRERTKLMQKEKEEKHRKLLQEKEERKREVMSQKKLDEHVRNQKIMEQKRRDLAEKEALEAAKAKHNESLQRKVLQKQHTKNKTKHDFEALDTDDSTDDEGKMNKNRAPAPMWSKGSYRRHAIRTQAFIHLNMIDKFFSVQPMTPDLKAIFPAIEANKLKRNSSAVWNTPPRYSQMPKY